MVKLKSGSPLMTVARLGDEPGFVVVVWTKNDGDLAMAELETVLLRKPAQRREPPPRQRVGSY